MRYFVGLDIGGTKCAATLAAVDGDKIEFLDKIKFATADVSPDVITERYAEFVNKYRHIYDIEKIGISAGGPLDPKNGILISPPHLPLWHGYNVTRRMKELTGIDAILENDANACAVAEWRFGAGRGCENMVFLTFGTGFGGGLILNGKLYSGTNGMAGEVGHLKIMERGCFGYGKTGAAEGAISGAGVGEYAREVVLKQLSKNTHSAIFDRADGDIKKIDAKLVGDMAKEGDATALKIYARTGKYLGRILATIIDMLNPEVIVIGGVYMRCENLLRGSMMREIEKEALSLSASVVRIVPAALGESIGDYSAVSLCL